MKIVLFGLNGSYTHTNLAIRCLRESLESDGHEVVLIEGNLRDRTSSLLHKLHSQKADIYGFSCYIWNIEQMISIAHDLSGILPSCRIIFGGPEVSFDTERFNNLDFIDAVICGEGEDALREVCRSISLGKKFNKIIEGTPSPLVMKNEGILYRNEDFCISEGSRILYYESSRGCPFGCAYCLSSVTHGIRAKSAEDTVEDLLKFESLEADFQIIKFVDRTFNFNTKRANKIWKALLSPKFTKKYHFEICSSLLDEESLEILSQMPPKKIQLEVGLQSTNFQTLDAVSRHLKAEETLEKCRKILSYGNIHLHLDLIAALPYESYTRFAKSFDDAYFCCHQLQLGFLKLLHGTSLRKNAKEYGYVYSSVPPYTVLKSNWIGYEELHSLEKISFLLERYRESGKFCECIDFAVKACPSPFEFYRGLSDYIMKNDGRDIHKISQLDAYKILYEYVKTLDAVDLCIFEEKMHSDFSRGEIRRPPQFLRHTSDKKGP